MEYLFLGLLVFGGWWAIVGLLYLFIIRHVLRDLTPSQRLELFKTRRQRNLRD